MIGSHDQDSPVWTQRAVERAKRMASDRLFADIPLQNPAQHFMLFVIERGSHGEVPLSQGEIAKRLQLSPATVTASLRPLEKLGLIERKPDEKDLRINRVTITPEGVSMVKRCGELMDTLEETTFKGFSEEELSQLTGFFKRMCSNLEAFAQETQEKEGGQ